MCLRPRREESEEEEEESEEEDEEDGWQAASEEDDEEDDAEKDGRRLVDCANVRVTGMSSTPSRLPSPSRTCIVPCGRRLTCTRPCG